MEGLAPRPALGPTRPIAVLLTAAVAFPIVRDLSIGRDQQLGVPLILLTDALLLALMAVGVATLRLRSAELGFTRRPLRGAAIGMTAAVALLLATGRWPHWWRPGLALTGIVVAVAAVLAEEACFRGVLFGALERTLGQPVALIGTTAAFALAHAGVYPLRALPLVALAGALLGVLRLLTGNVAAPLAAHLLLNLSMVAGVVSPAPLILDSFQPPQPYRFVSPPPGFSSPDHANPTGGETPVPLTGGSSDPASAFTDDGQITVSFTQGTFTAPAGQTAVDIRITPVRPQPAAPTGLVPDGNAYAIQATFVPSGQPVQTLNEPVLLDFRYPAQKPDSLYRIEGSQWITVGGTSQDLLLTIDTSVSQLGTFIAAHHRSNPVMPAPAWWRGPALIGGLAVAAVILLWLVAGVRIGRRS